MQQHMVKAYLSWKRKDISLRESLLDQQRVKGIVKHDKIAGLKLTVSFTSFFTETMVGNMITAISPELSFPNDNRFNC